MNQTPSMPIDFLKNSQAINYIIVNGAILDHYAPNPFQNVGIPPSFLKILTAVSTTPL